MPLSAMSGGALPSSEGIGTACGDDCIIHRSEKPLHGGRARDGVRAALLFDRDEIAFVELAAHDLAVRSVGEPDLQDDRQRFVTVHHEHCFRLGAIVVLVSVMPATT